MIEEKQAAKLLAIEEPDTTTFLTFRTGLRTRAVRAMQEGVAHRFQEKQQRVVVKLYKGKGDTPGSQEYQHYRQRYFQTIQTLTENDSIQQSIAGGVMAGVGPFHQRQGNHRYSSTKRAWQRITYGETQGALLALTSLRGLDVASNMDAASWQQLCTDTVRLAYKGTVECPLSFPSRLRSPDREAYGETCLVQEHLTQC